MLTEETNKEPQTTPANPEAEIANEESTPEERGKLCCTGCDVIVQAAAPSRPIDRGLAGPGLLAHVLTSKFCDHLPLYRQSEK